MCVFLAIYIISTKNNSYIAISFQTTIISAYKYIYISYVYICIESYRELCIHTKNKPIKGSGVVRKFTKSQRLILL